ncbi:hypothetical protein FOIG_06867 [Fusarium odoratissimum NRRL 54006]|uniref:Major facilitator superfamily (MFS) profile domain-containing protein n=1 Tax=Fusarium odoratissimum (strain NRRL 54006) TaxID=1089451 RepID=X0L1B6_FUSO5|nr:uncharacterized protein FOIG_06867 [Fusarium odoratissimum NRRL 54006]EXM02740.1 hypothetical protein FOIG_06867 [Fusarium odoratissimum NRRL 54006]
MAIRVYKSIDRLGNDVHRLLHHLCALITFFSSKTLPSIIQCLMAKSLKQPFFGLRGGWLTFWITVRHATQPLTYTFQPSQVACATDMTLFGYYQGVFSGVVVTQDFLKLHNLVGPTKTNVLATVTAIYDIGCFVGAVIALTIGEKLGRKKVIIVGTVIMSIGTIIKVTSYSLPQMIVGRVVLGEWYKHRYSTDMAD